jgi:hypothetical protein
MTRYAPCLLLCALASSGQAVKPTAIVDGGVEFYQRPDASAAGGLTGFWIEFKKDLSPMGRPAQSSLQKECGIPGRCQ